MYIHVYIYTHTLFHYGLLQANYLLIPNSSSFIAVQPPFFFGNHKFFPYRSESVSVLFPGGASGKEPIPNAGGIRGVGLIPGLEGSLWRRTHQPTLVSLPGESHGQRSLVGYRP